MARAAKLRERQEWLAQCRELQATEVERIQAELVPTGRVQVGDLSDAGRVVVLNAKSDGAAQWRIEAMLTPMHPLREAAVLKFEFHGEPCVDTASEWRNRALKEAIERAVARVQSERVGQTILVELFAAIDNVIVEAMPIAPKAPRVTFDFAGADASADEVEFIGAHARSRAFEMNRPDVEVPDGSTATLVGTRLFVIGGYSKSKLPLVRVFDVAKRTWFVPTPSVPRNNVRLTLGGHCTARVGHRLYSFGGVMSGESMFAVSILDTKTMEWSFVVAPFYSNLHNMTATSVGEDIFVIGGVSSAVSVTRAADERHIYVFDTKLNSFRSFNCPNCLQSDKGKECQLCAMNPKAPQFKNVVLAFRKTFESFPSLSLHTTTRVGDWLLIHGGLVDSEVLPRSCFLNVRDLRFGELPPSDVVRPRANHMAVRIGERFVAMIGGRMAEDPVSQIDVFDLYRKEWHARTPQSHLVMRLGGTAIALHSGELLLLFGHNVTVDRRMVRTQYAFPQAITANVYEARPALLLDLGLPRATPPSQLATTLTQALRTGEHTDIGWRSLRLHRPLLAARCPRLIELIEESHRDLCELSDATLDGVVKLIYGDVPLGVTGAELRALKAVLRWEGDTVAPLQLALGAYFDNDELRERTADVAFVCRGEDGADTRLRVHRLFVQRVEHFRMVLSAGMIESATGEIRVIESVECVRAALRFFYCDHLEASSAIVGAELLLLADRVGAETLKQHTEHLIESFYDFGDLGNVVDLVDIAERATAAHLLQRSLSVLRSDFSRKDIIEYLASTSGSVSESAARLIRNATSPTGGASLLHNVAQ